MPSRDPSSLNNLHAIVEPEAVSLWWPLALGWWIILAFSLLALAFAAWRMISTYRRNAYRREALEALGNTDPQQLQALLKRVALSAYPRSQVAGLTGPDWIAFLNRQAPETFDDAAATQLLSLSYVAGSEDDAYQRLADACRRWITDHKPTTEAPA